MEATIHTFTLPRETFNLLATALGSQQNAETFAKSMEAFLVAIDHKATVGITEKKELLKVEVREALRKELVTREQFDGLVKETREGFKLVDERFKLVDQRFRLVDERFNGVDERFKRLEEKMDVKFNAVDEKFKALEEKMEGKFKALEDKMEVRFKGLEERVEGKFIMIDDRFKAVNVTIDERFKRLDLKLNIFLVIALAALTFANPAFVELIKRAF